MRGEIHYLITGAKTDKDFLKKLSTSSSDVVDVVRVSCLVNNNSPEDLNEIAEVCNGKVLFFTDATCSKSFDLQPDGLFFHDPEEALHFQNKTTGTPIIGGLARTYADCKNLELAGAKYILLKPKRKDKSQSILGTESFSNLIPKNEEYGWMITSINIPVIASGIHSLRELKELKRVADIAGVQISASFEPEMNITEKLEKIRSIFT